MKNLNCLGCPVEFLVLVTAFLLPAVAANAEILVPSDDQDILYVGRFDDSTPTAPVAYWSGTQIRAKFQGTMIKAVLNDFGDNFYNVIIDGGVPVKLDLLAGSNTYVLAMGLADTEHTVELFKRTSHHKGAVAFEGFYIDDARELVPLERPLYKIEFYGDSISDGHSVDIVGADDDSSTHWNNYLAHPAVASRMLGVEYVCNASSGIAVHTGWSPGAEGNLMGTAYDNINPTSAASVWDFSKYTPDIVVVNLFQNDAWANPVPHPPPEATAIKDKYRDLILDIRAEYPNAEIFCALGNMDACAFGYEWGTYVEAVVAALNGPSYNDSKVYSTLYAYINDNGHPHAARQRPMAHQLASFIKATLPGMFPADTATPLLVEDFEGSNVAYTWTVNSGNWSDTGVQYEHTPSGSGTAVVGDSAWSDYTVQSDIQTTSAINTDDTVGLIFRYVDADNYYWVDIVKNGANPGLVRINKRDGGAESVLHRADNYFAPAPDSYDAADSNKIKVIVTGDEIVVYVNDRCVFVEYDSTFAAGKVGYRANSAAGICDNLTVTQHSAPPAAAPTGVTLPATQITHNSAYLNYSVDDGNDTTSVTIYWGTTDGGTTPGSWANSIAVGNLSDGIYIEELTGLLPNLTYYYNVVAANGQGGSWGTTQSFTALNQQTALYYDSFNVHGTPNPGDQVLIDGLNPETNNDAAAAAWTGNRTINSTPSSGSSFGIVKNNAGAITANFGSQSGGNNGQGGSAWLPVTNPTQYGTISAKAELYALNNASRAYLGFSGPLATNDNNLSESVWSQATADGLYFAFETNDSSVITQAGIYYGSSANQVFDLMTTGGYGTTLANYTGHTWELRVDIDNDAYDVIRDGVVVAGGNDIAYPGGFLEANTLDVVSIAGEFYPGSGSWRAGWFDEFEVVTTPPARAVDFAAWMVGHGAADTSAGGDEDNDGVSNLSEYAYSTAANPVNPTVNDASNSTLSLLPSLSVNGSDQLVLHFVRADILPANVSIKIEASTDLSSWTDITGSVTVAHDGPDGLGVGTDASHYTYTNPAPIGGANANFMRVVIEEN